MENADMKRHADHRWLRIFRAVQWTGGVVVGDEVTITPRRRLREGISIASV
jgi:hypothetical protein